MDHRILWICLISVSTMALAEKPAFQSSGYVYRRGFAYDVPDPYEQSTAQQKQADVKLSWDFSEQPQATCLQSGTEGVYHYSDSCSIRKVVGGQLHCRIVTRKSLSHELLGRLFVACQNGEAP